MPALRPFPVPPPALQLPVLGDVFPTLASLPDFLTQLFFSLSLLQRDSPGLGQFSFLILCPQEEAMAALDFPKASGYSFFHIYNTPFFQLHHGGVWLDGFIVPPFICP